MVELDETTKAKVLKQIEFYFSDSNLPKDKFLRQQVEAHPEGYVDLSLIISFQRMRDVLKLGTVRPEDVPDELVTAVAGALQESQLMEVHSTGFQVRRKTALPSAKEAARAVDSRSLYVRPFPMHTSLDQIVSFFQDAGAQLNAVRVRRHLRSRDFKGSVFIEASSVEEAQRVLGLSLEFEGAPLRMERKQHYLARKIAERKAKKLGTSAEELTLAMLEEMDSDVEISAITEINKDVQLLPAGAAAAAAAAGNEQPPAKKRKQSAGPADADSADSEMADAPAAAAEQATAAEAAEPEVEQYDAGCILMLTLQGQPAESDPHKLTKMIKEALGPDKIRFVEQQRQQAQEDKAGADSATAEQRHDCEEAQDMQQEAEPQPEEQQQQEQEQQQAAGGRQFMVRFRQPDQAQELLQAFAAAAGAGEHKQVAGCAAELRVVEGEEEEQYYKRAAVQRATAAKRGESGGRGGRGGGRGGFRGGGRGGRGGVGRGGGFRGGRGGRGRGRGRH